MNGIYLYCIREKNDETCTFAAPGVGGEGDVFAIPYRRLEAVVSEVSLEDFSSRNIKELAGENLAWIKEKALAHEEVVEESFREGAHGMVPARFGILYRSRDRVEEFLRDRCSDLERILADLRGRQEWCIKVYLKDEERFKNGIRASHPALREMDAKIRTLPEGMAYFMEEEIRETLARETESGIQTAVERIVGALEDKAEKSVIGGLLVRELTGRPERMILNATFLVSMRNRDVFLNEAGLICEEVDAEGFILECSGPWPPYNFSSW